MAPDPDAELSGWAGGVLRIHRESQGSAEQFPDYWGPYDLVGVYHQRDRLEAARGSGQDVLLEVVDELLRSFSEDVGPSWVEAIGLSGEAGSGWWWRFVPRGGPLRAELQERVGRGTG